MINDDKDSINPQDLPHKDVFEKKEVYQYPQPADTGVPIDSSNKKKTTAGNKEQTKTSKEEGLNEEKSDGEAGAFEGFEDQQR